LGGDLGGDLGGHMMNPTQQLCRFQYHLYYMFVNMVLSTFFNIIIQYENIHTTNIMKKS
jgi:hypothetical protein